MKPHRKSEMTGAEQSDVVEQAMSTWEGVMHFFVGSLLDGKTPKERVTAWSVLISASVGAAVKDVGAEEVARILQSATRIVQEHGQAIAAAADVDPANQVH
jgi:hypothetical protein